MHVLLVEQWVQQRGVPPDEVSSTAKEKDFALSEGDLMGDVGGVVLDIMSIFRGSDSAPSRATVSLPDAIPSLGYPTLVPLSDRLAPPPLPARRGASTPD